MPKLWMGYKTAQLHFAIGIGELPKNEVKKGAEKMGLRG
jgi:hypothetical protein